MDLADFIHIHSARKQLSLPLAAAARACASVYHGAKFQNFN